MVQAVKHELNERYHLEKQVEYAVWSRTGLVRKKNQDNLYCSDSFLLDEENDGMPDLACSVRPVSSRCLFAVFDGMGGERSGETAAYMAADCMARMDSRVSGWKKGMFPRQFFTSYCQKANQEIDDFRRSKRFHAMGTTVACVMVLHHRIVACNVGDSRIYQCSGENFRQVSTDHAERQLFGNQALTQYLGVPPEEMLIEPAICTFPCHSGDQYLLCTDGVWNCAGDKVLRDRFLSGKSIQDRMRNIFDLVSESGERDNATAILLKLI